VIYIYNAPIENVSFIRFWSFHITIVTLFIVLLNLHYIKMFQCRPIY